MKSASSPTRSSRTYGRSVSSPSIRFAARQPRQCLPRARPAPRQKRGGASTGRLPRRFRSAIESARFLLHSGNRAETHGCIEDVIMPRSFAHCIASLSVIAQYASPGARYNPIPSGAFRPTRSKKPARGQSLAPSAASAGHIGECVAHCGAGHTATVSPYGSSRSRMTKPRW